MSVSNCEKLSKKLAVVSDPRKEQKLQADHKRAQVLNCQKTCKVVLTETKDGLL